MEYDATKIFPGVKKGGKPHFDGKPEFTFNPHLSATKTATSIKGGRMRRLTRMSRSNSASSTSKNLAAKGATEKQQVLTRKAVMLVNMIVVITPHRRGIAVQLIFFFYVGQDLLMVKLLFAKKECTIYVLGSPWPPCCLLPIISVERDPKEVSRTIESF